MASFIKYSFLCLVLCLAVQPAVGDCACRGDVTSLSGVGPPDGNVSIGDLAAIVNVLYNYGVPGVAPSMPATIMPCADVADLDAQGVSGGDGVISVSDVVFIAAHVSDYAGTLPPYVAPCTPDTLPASADAEILLTINGMPWNGTSSAQPGDIVHVVWRENEETWNGGFANFNLNVSRGTYNEDFSTGQNWSLAGFDVQPDGSGGFDVGCGCVSISNFDAGDVFIFSFLVPDETGPAYNISIAPTQGSWRMVMYYDLPSVTLPVAGSGTEPELLLTSPNGGETLSVGSTHTIQWDTTGSIDNVKLEYSTNNAETWTTIIGSTPNTGSYQWLVPSVDSDNCLVRVTDAADSEINDQSDAVFTITIPKTVTVLSPNGGENLTAGSTHTIQWNTTGDIDNVTIEFSTDNGQNWSTVDLSTANTGSCEWLIPSVNSDQCLINVRDSSDTNINDQSDSVFSISIPWSITVLSPNGGENLNVGSTHTIQWNTTGSIENVTVEYSADNAESWATVIESTPNTGSYEWLVPATESDLCLIRLYEVNGTPIDTSDETFSISIIPTLTLTSPNGGENLVAGNTAIIHWTSIGQIENVTIQLSLNDGQYWSTIVESIENDGIFEWTPIPQENSDQCLIMISDTDNAQVNDTCDDHFTIFQCLIAPIPGDLNNDCYVNLLDLAILAQYWMVCGNPFDSGCVVEWIENFDDGDISDWTIENPYPSSAMQLTLGLSDEQSVSPDYSIKISEPSYGYGARAFGPDLPIDLDKPYSISFMFRYNSIHWYHMINFGSVALVPDVGGNQMQYPRKGGWSELGTATFGSYCPRNTWTHFYVEVNPSTYSYDLYVNDNFIGTASYGQGYDTGKRGFYFRLSSSGASINGAYYDDIVIAGERLW
ncbi:MAG: hypothetical protein KAS23_10005 [Anaerohalosphaera sp.]|nr:hypothetical protein [Anaerohalosphaera sp.]